MIKPSSLWALCKSCDPHTLGRVCAVLGGQDVEPKLNAPEMALVSVVQHDSEWMEESAQIKRDRWAAAKKAARAKKCSTNHEMSSNVRETNEDTERTSVDTDRTSECPQMSDGHRGTLDGISSIHPSFHPSSTLDIDKSISASTCITRTRTDVPTLEEVLNAARSAMGVPPWYAGWWYTTMEAYNWTTTKGLRINHSNWRPLLKAWHNRSVSDPAKYAALQEEYAPKAKAAPAVVKAEDWTLCSERCALFRGGKCGRGKSMPPNLAANPYPPEECSGFKAKEET